MIRSGNPALQKSTFQNLRFETNNVMTLDGAVNKTAISMCILLLTAYYTYSNAIMDYIMIGFIGGFIIALVTIFKKHWSPITVPIYAALEGLALGGISNIYANAFEQDPDFYSFYRSMQAYGNVLGEEGTTMILSPDSEFLEFFNNSKGQR